MKKNSSKLIIAIALVLVSAVMLSTASYAWFTMQKEASVQKFNLTATAPTSIQIGVGHNLTTTDAAWKSVVTFDSASLKALKPSSSSNGWTMFDISDKTKESAQTTGFAAVSTPVSSTEEGFYIDIPLSFRTLGNTATNPIMLDVSNSSIAIDTAGNKDIYKAVRVAFINKDKTATAYSSTNIWAPLTNGTATTPGLLAASSATTTAAQTIFITNTSVIPALAAGNQTTPGAATEIVVRIWIEGQDSFCKSLNAGGSFSVALKFIESTNP